MKLSDINDNKPRTVAVGTFDGMHRGHAEVIRTLLDVARSRQLIPTVVTFNRHPLDVVCPERSPKMLALPDTRANAITRQDCECFMIDFDEQTAAITAREWMQFMHQNAGMQILVVGYDNTFGSDGINKSVADFAEIGKEIGVEVIEAPLVSGISSSDIRKAIINGDIENASDMLDAHYVLEGPVVRGRGFGKKLGYPTANIMPDPRLVVPARGVYAAMATLPDGRRFPASVNIGIKPTVGIGETPTIEAHIFGIDESLYGLILKLEFYKRLRDEHKFASFDALTQAIGHDKETTLNFFKENS